jgi:hypothetical protein
MKQAISGAITNRKRNHENDGQKQGQNLPINPPMILSMNGPLSGQIFCQTTSRGRGTFKEEHP